MGSDRREALDAKFCALETALATTILVLCMTKMALLHQCIMDVQSLVGTRYISPEFGANRQL